MEHSEISVKKESAGQGRARRFGVFRIVEHLALIALFITLAMTGLPQKFYSLGVSQFIIAGLGGVDSVRSIHHIAGPFSQCSWCST